MKEDHRAATLWIKRLEVPTDLERDLTDFVAFPNGVQEYERLGRFIALGPRAVIPLVTTAAFVLANVREHVLDVIRRVGDGTAPSLIALLDQPLFEPYRAVWRKAGVADLGAVSEARSAARYVYAISLEGLADLVEKSKCVKPWFADARHASVPYQASEEMALSNPARAVVHWIDIEASIALGIAPPIPQGNSGTTGGSVAATGWGQSEAARTRYLQEQAARAEDEARRTALGAEFAAFWFLEQQRKKHDRG